MALAPVIPLQPPGDATAPDAELVVRARGGDRRAAEALYVRHRRHLLGTLRRLAPWDGDVEDLMQDIFAEAFEQLGRLQAPAAFGAWVRTMAIRKAGNRIRRRQLMRRFGLLRAEPFEADAFLSPGAPPDVVAELRAVYRVVRTLPVECRMALVLHRVEGLPVREVAESLGISASTVKRRLATAQASLDRELAATGPALRPMTPTARPPKGTDS